MAKREELTTGTFCLTLGSWKHTIFLLSSTCREKVYCIFSIFFSLLVLKYKSQRIHQLKDHEKQTQNSSIISQLKVLNSSAAAKSLQSCPTLCDPVDSSPPGSSVPGILQARTLEWVAISSSNAWKWKVKVKSLSRVRLLATPWTAAYQAPLSWGFSRQEYWSGVPLPSPSETYKRLYI